MKRTIIHLLFYSVFTLGVAGCHSAKTDARNQDFPEFKAGETITVIDGLKVYAESVSATNLQNVIIYGYDDNDQLKTTVKAESLDYTSTDNEIEITLYNASIETKDDEGNPITVEAKIYPISLNKKALENIADQSAEPTPFFKAGEKTTLLGGAKIYAETVSSTGLKNVILYGDVNDINNPTLRAESADYTITEEEIKFTFYNAILEGKDDQGKQQDPLEVKSVPLTIPRDDCQPAG